MSDKEIILPSNPKAATFQKLEGWVSRQGQFFGKNEDSARYAGSTHSICAGCKNPFERRGFTVCESCHEDHQIKKYKGREREEWNDQPGVYSEANAEYFWCLDTLRDYCFENKCTLESLRLLHIDPVHLNQVDAEHWSDQLPEDEYELPDDVQTAVDALNDAIDKSGPVSYYPNQIAIQFTQQQLNYIEAPGNESAA